MFLSDVEVLKFEKISTPLPFQTACQTSLYENTVRPTYFVAFIIIGVIAPGVTLQILSTFSNFPCVLF